MADPAADEEKHVLPDDAIPVNYNLVIEPDLDRCDFVGSVEITYNVEVATSEIHLHAKQLVFNEAYFEVAADGRKIDAEEISFNVKETTVKISFGATNLLPTGEAVGKLVIPNYIGILNDQMAGFYRSEYICSRTSEKRRLAVTQFEAIDARRCFPCVDEPGVKSTFDCTLIVNETLECLSNMPVKTMKVIPGTLSDKESHPKAPPPGGVKGKRKRYEFFQTPKMSTYLVAFVVGELDMIASKTKEGTEIRCLSVPGKSSELEFALDVGVKCLEFYNDFFQIPYPLPKLDMVAIPDFAAGAMENWGLVTYREIDLLCDPLKASTTRKTRVATVVTHELAHQWFGNLVTMDWWDELWCNEGFANFMQSFSADTLFPDWHIWEQFVSDDQAAALRLDSLRSSHPIQVPIPRAEQVEEIFDAISYCKGGSVVRMIYATLGKEKFQEGLQLYMERHSYANTKTTDLWKAWEEVSGKPVENMMKGWTLQMGYPILDVDYSVLESDPTTGEVISKDMNKVKVSQRWYIADNSVEPGDEEKVWTIPMLFATDKGYDVDVQFMEEVKEQEFELSAGSKWVKLNAGQFVPMRVKYSPEMLNALSANVNQLSAEDRMGLILDTYELCKSGHFDDLGSLIGLLNALKNETSPNVWDAIKLVIDAIEKPILDLDPSILEAYRKFVAGIIEKPFAMLGWDPKPEDSDLTKHLRGMMISLCATYNPEIMREEAEIRYDAFVEDQTTSLLPDDYKRPVFLVMLKNESRGKEVWESLLKIAKKPETAQAHRLSIFGCLGYIPDLEWKRKTLEETYNIKIQDFFYPMHGVTLSGKEGNTLIFEWLKEDWDKIKDRVKNASGSLLQAVVSICCAGNSAERADEVEKFFADKSEPAIVRTLKQVCEKTRISARFLDIVKSSAINTPEFWKEKYGL